MTCTCGWVGDADAFSKHFDKNSDNAKYHAEQIATPQGLPAETVKANPKPA